MKQERNPRPSRPPKVLPDLDDPASWYASIEPDGLWPWTPWRVTLRCGAMRYGANEGWGWSCMTLAGARRRAERELRKYRAKLVRRAQRRARIAAA